MFFLGTKKFSVKLLKLHASLKHIPDRNTIGRNIRLPNLNLLQSVEQINGTRESEEGRGDRKFSKMLELLGSRNLKMLKLLGIQLAQKGLFLKNFRSALWRFSKI